MVGNVFFDLLTTETYDKDRNVVWEGEWKNGYGNMGNGIGLYYEDGKKCGWYKNGNVKSVQVKIEVILIYSMNEPIHLAYYFDYEHYQFHIE